MESNHIIQSHKRKPIPYEIPSDDDENQTLDDWSVDENDKEINIQTANKKARIECGYSTLLSTVLLESNENVANYDEQHALESITIINENTNSNIETVPKRTPRLPSPLTVKDVTIKPDKTINQSCIRISITFEGGPKARFLKDGELEKSCDILAKNTITGSDYNKVDFIVLSAGYRSQIQLAVGVGKGLEPSMTYALRLVYHSLDSGDVLLNLTHDDDLLSIPAYKLFCQYDCTRHDVCDSYGVVWKHPDSGHRSYFNTDKNTYFLEYFDITDNCLMNNIISNVRVENIEAILSDLNRVDDSNLHTIEFSPLHKAGYSVSLAYDEDDVELKLSLNYGMSYTFKPNHMYVTRLRDPYSDWYYIPYIFMEPLVPTMYATDTHGGSGQLNIIGNNYDPSRTTLSASSTSTSTSSSSSTAPTSVAPPPAPTNTQGAATAPLCVGCANEANMLLKPCGHAFICEPCCDATFRQPMWPTVLCPHCPPDTSVAVGLLIKYTKPDRKCRNIKGSCTNNANTVLSTCGHMVYCDTCVSEYAVCGVLGCSTPYTKADVVIRVVR